MKIKTSVLVIVIIISGRFLNTIDHLQPTYIGQKTGLGSSCGLKAGILACHVRRSLPLFVYDGTRPGRRMCCSLCTFLRRAHNAVFGFILSTALIKHALLPLEIPDLALVLLYLRLDRLEIALADSVRASSQRRGARPTRERVHLNVASLTSSVLRH